MIHVKLFFCVEALLYIVTGVKVNVQGSLSLGRDVVESLSHYLGKDFLSGRRSFDPPQLEDPITLAVKTALLCKDLELCHNEHQHFVNEYIIILAKAVASIMSSEPNFNNQTYEEELTQSLQHIRNILEDANAKVNKQTEVYYWTHIIKRISAEFQNIMYFDMTIGSDLEDITQKTATTNVHHKIVIVTAFVERKYHIKLCSDYNICSMSHKCTEALNKLLIHFKSMPEDRVRLFIKYFYQALFETPFYGYLTPANANEFQIILNDMSFTNDTPTKDVMLSVLKTVEARIEMIQLNKPLVVAHEILLANTILSDVDHMVNNHTDMFTMFLNKFYDWLASDRQLEKHIRALLSDVGKLISSSEKDLFRKLIDEVEVFLEMTC